MRHSLNKTTPASAGVVALAAPLASTVSSICSTKRWGATTPANGATFIAPASITLAATAADSDGTIQKVEFFQGGTTLIGTATSAPYSVTWGPVAVGAYSVTAVATDDANATTTSTPLSVTVISNALPTVSITSPSAGANFTAPANITVSATALDPDGTIQKVEFFQGTNLIATLTAPPYSFTWTAVPQGTYLISPEWFDWLDERLDVCNDIRKFTDKFVAHAAEPSSRTGLTPEQTGVTLDRLAACHKAVYQVAAFIYGPLLWERSYGAVPTPQYDHLENLEKGWIKEVEAEIAHEFWNKNLDAIEKWESETLWPEQSQ